MVAWKDVNSEKTKDNPLLGVGYTSCINGNRSGFVLPN
mgnify:CR=1 FL=1